MNRERREARLLTVKVILQRGYEWLTRDKDGTTIAHENKPFRLTEDLDFDLDGGKYLMLDNANDLDFVKWEDDEPVNIREWLEKEEEEMKMYSVKDGKVVIEEVDATNGIVALGVNDVVELDRDNEIVTDGVTIQVNDRNSGKSAILEKAKEIDSKILADLGSSCGDLTVSPLMQFPYLTSNIMSNEGQDCDETDWDCLNNFKIHEKICVELNETYEKKNSDYGNSFENSLDKHGMIAGIVRMDDKMSRLISLNSKNEQQVMDESMRDTLMDLANYAIISVMWLDEQ